MQTLLYRSTSVFFASQLYTTSLRFFSLFSVYPSFDMWKPTDNFICGFHINVLSRFRLFPFLPYFLIPFYFAAPSSSSILSFSFVQFVHWWRGTAAFDICPIESIIHAVAFWWTSHHFHEYTFTLNSIYSSRWKFSNEILMLFNEISATLFFHLFITPISSYR